MCDDCANEDNAKVARKLYDEWLEEQGLKAGTFLGAFYETGITRLPGTGLLVLQKTTDRTNLTEDGVEPLPETKLNGIILHEDEIASFIQGIFYQMGPRFMFGLLGKEYEGDDDA